MQIKTDKLSNGTFYSFDSRGTRYTIRKDMMFDTPCWEVMSRRLALGHGIPNTEYLTDTEMKQRSKALGNFVDFMNTFGDGLVPTKSEAIAA